MTAPAFVPRLMQATAAAHYLGVSRTKFRRSLSEIERYTRAASRRRILAGG